MDLVLEDGPLEEGSVDACDHVVDPAEGRLGAVRTEALAEEEQLRSLVLGHLRDPCLHRVDQLPTGVGGLLGIDEERDPTRQEGVLHGHERGVAVVDVLDRVGSLGVDPARPRGGEHRDHVALPCVGPVELGDGQLHTVGERVGGIESDVDADRLLRPACR